MRAGPSLLVLVLMLAAVPARANPYLEEGRRAFTELRFRDAIAQLEVARQVPTSSREQRLEILDLLARALLSEGRRADAEAAFTELLTIDPSAQMAEDAAPKIREAFHAAKHALYPEGYVSLRSLTAPPGNLRLELKDPWRRVGAIVVRERSSAGEPWRAVSFAPQPVLSHAFSAPGTSYWYAEAIDAQGEVMARVNGPEAPALAGVVEIEKAPPARARTAAWVVAGASVALGVGAAWLAQSAIARDAAARDNAQAPGDWADTARQTHARAQSEAAAAWTVGAFAAVGAIGAGVLFLW